jgi:haloalkane dehalogenase
MRRTPISAEFPFEMRRVAVRDSEIAYVDAGSGPPIVLLHGNPTSSYLWRNIIPHLTGLGRCLAPDLVGFGRSGRSPRYAYRFADQSAYLDAWFDALGLNCDVTLVVHDWGAALGFWRACRHPDSIRAIAYMEAMVRPRLWSDMPPDRVALFQRLRGPEGEQMVLAENFFIEHMLFRAGIVRDLSEAEKAVYRAPFTTAASRIPTLVFPREIPFEGEPADNAAVVQRYSNWLATSANLPKLFINAEQGHGLAGAARDFARTWPNQREISLPGKHYLQEDYGHEIGEAVARFIAEVRGA